jgi:hypothetical protein
MDISTGPSSRRPEVLDWENEGGAIRPHLPEPEGVAEPVPMRSAYRLERFVGAMRDQRFIVGTAALVVGMFVGNRFFGRIA